MAVFPLFDPYSLSPFLSTLLSQIYCCLCNYREIKYVQKHAGAAFDALARHVLAERETKDGTESTPRDANKMNGQRQENESARAQSPGGHRITGSPVLSL